MMWESGNFRHDGHETAETMKKALAESLEHTPADVKFSIEIDLQRLDM